MKDQVIMAVSGSQECAARAPTEGLVGGRLVACANPVPTGVATCRRQGRVTSERESFLLIKSAESRCGALWARIRDPHPDDLAELVTLSGSGGSAACLDRVRTGTACGLEA